MIYQLVFDLLLWVPALVFSSIVLTLSYWLKPEDLPKGRAQALIRFSTLATLSTVVYAMLALLGQPWVEARLDSLVFSQVQTRQLEDAYLSLEAQGTDQQTESGLEARFSLLKRLGLLRPLQGQSTQKERMDYDFELQILRAHSDLDAFFKLRALPGVASAGNETKSTTEDLLLKAEEALKGTDGEYQANLWGFLAYRQLLNFVDQGKVVDQKLLDRAKTVVDQSWARVYEKTLASDERLKASYFFRKGKSLGDFEFQNYLEAYYGFQELHRENPRDSEVARHWELSRQRIAEQVLFAQEMEVLFAVPGSDKLVFLNRDSPPEVVRIGKLLNTSQGVFVKDFEFLRFDAQGRTLLHWTAPYGRWTDEGINFRVWNKEEPIAQFPMVHQESVGNEFNPEASVDPPLFLPRVTVRDLEVVNSQQPRPQTMGTMDLLIHGQAIEALGYNSRLFQTEFVVRLAAPFGFFVVFLLIFALAWVNRAQEAGRTWWFLIPILPLVAEFLVQSAEWVSRLAVGGLLEYLGLETTTVTLGVLFLAGSVAGVILVQRSFQKSLQ
jgi:hypothetical protein